MLLLYDTFGWLRKFLKNRTKSLAYCKINEILLSTFSYTNVVNDVGKLIEIHSRRWNYVSGLGKSTGGW